MEISPNTLEFKGSFQKQTTEFLTLYNSSPTPLAFKVKTTAPKLYCVRPNASLLRAGESMKISVILQGFSQPLPADYKCKDKFLLVSLPAPDIHDASKVGEYWPSLEAKYKSQMVSKKLRVNYRIGEDADESFDYTQTTESSLPEPSPVPEFNGNGSARERSVYHEPALNNFNREVHQPQQREVHDPSPREIHQPTFQPPVQQQQQAPVVEKRSPVAAQASPELQRELEALANQVRSLSSKLDDNERATAQAVAQQRRAAFDNNTEPVNGISMPVALLLVLISFLIGWLIF
ncbi:uncharacterized protein SPAPADRAFT_157575 [Spathaspora passalidarum NRRL Y-27907]|uniref:MSP domain-containing protein n=1 Tax=Spathaspora passalidarum (strain NRRL Y-27907 / 11-Y1) TaxID=619300 RepID=G3AUA7_SPAPN|nr:uncharacterized protein SPAPADRAFT_157575 [Spathaspora passalidarum NRRL Y-27907]EGW30483.1 hypothetical protein SPAPADRAFT_157575 [Spathaspora passalidarum NRRL Y-27907]